QEGIRRLALVVLVEGYMDALQAHQAGFDNVVAVMGTALTERQVNQLKRVTKRFALALDPDAAGEEATRRSLEGAWHLVQRDAVRVAGAGTLTLRLEVPDLRVISLPLGKDPDEVIRADPEDWRHRVENATPILDYLIRWEASRPEAATPAGKLAAVDRVFPLIAAVENPFEQEAAFRSLAQALGVEERALEAAAGRPRRRGRGRSGVAEATPSALTQQEGDPVEEHLLGLVLRHGAVAWQALAAAGLDSLPPDCFQRPENAELWRILTRGDPVTEAEALVSTRAEQLQAGVQVPVEGPALGRALTELARRLAARRLKAQEEEAALAASGTADSLTLDETVRQQFIERTAHLRALERSRPGP
ncbi:MAG: toprim domain-containing protein, partial [Chloroflexi bacterium]|nr:toprim domain-containing protein [Chloroflexota bacterium]